MFFSYEKRSALGELCENKFGEWTNKVQNHKMLGLQKFSIFRSLGDSGNNSADVQKVFLILSQDIVAAHKTLSTQ